jgi:helix-turn-helix, Psq domain
MEIATVKKSYGAWSQKNLASAVGDIAEKECTFGEAARKWSIPKTTLYDHVKKNNKFANGEIKTTGRRTVFSEAMESALAESIKEFAANLFGLTCEDVRKFAFEIAEKRGIPNNFDPTTKMAGKKWLRGFLRRHPDLSIRTPEKLSYARIEGFTEEKVLVFYSVLERVCVEKNIDATRIFNMDESGFATVINKAPKVVAQKGSQVSTAASGERGTNTTVVCCVSASGQWVPPMVIFKGSRISSVYGIGLVAGMLLSRLS